MGLSFRSGQKVRFWCDQMGTCCGKYSTRRLPIYIAFQPPFLQHARRDLLLPVLMTHFVQHTDCAISRHEHPLHEVLQLEAGSRSVDTRSHSCVVNRLKKARFSLSVVTVQVIRYLPIDIVIFIVLIEIKWGFIQFELRGL